MQGLVFSLLSHHVRQPSAATRPSLDHFTRFFIPLREPLISGFIRPSNARVRLSSFLDRNQILPSDDLI